MPRRTDDGRGEGALPTKLQISPTDGLDLDERYALTHFLGKTADEAARLYFAPANNLPYIEDFEHMGGEALRFYFPTVEPYLRDASSAGDATFAGGLVFVVQLRLDLGNAGGAVPELRSVLQTVDRLRAKFELDDEVVACLQQQLARLG